MHLGATANLVVAAERQRVEREARDLLARLGQPEPLGHPVEELLRLGAEVKAGLAVLRERVAELGRLAAFDRQGVERERAAVKLYGEALDRSHRVLADLARLGLEERQVRIEEEQARVLFEVTMAALNRAQVPVQLHGPFREAMAAELRERDVIESDTA